MTKVTMKAMRMTGNKILSGAFALAMSAMVLWPCAGCAKGYGYDRDSLEEVVVKAMGDCEWSDDKTVYNRFFVVTDSIVRPASWAERLKADFTSGFFSNFSTTDLRYLLDAYMEHSQCDSLRQRVANDYESFRQRFAHLFPGSPAPDISFTDMQGRHLSLQSLRGKTLLVDIWGTWCAPCIAEIPYLEKLQKAFADRTDVMIMSIACDKKESTWKAFLGRHSTTWHQFLVTQEGNNVLDKKYYCDGIPRFIIIGPDGLIVNADAPRPSEDTFMEYFKGIVEGYADK